MRAWLWIGAAAWLACAPKSEKPAEGAGIVAPAVDPGLAADWTFRWPEPASVVVTLRVDGGLGAKVLRSEVELGPADAQGARELTRGTFEAVEGGGLGAESMALSLGLVLSPVATKVDHRGNLVSGGDPLWVSWVPFWATFAAPAAAEDGVTRDDHPSQVWPGARHLVYRSTARIGKKVTGLSGSLWGDLRETTFEGDVDPRTLQPLRVVQRLQYSERELPIVMIYEFDWSKTNERLRHAGVPETPDALDASGGGDGQRPNGDIR